MTDLGDHARESEERQRMRNLGGGKGCKDCKLGTDPHSPNPDGDRYLRSHVHNSGTMLVQSGQQAKADEHERPAHIILRAVAIPGVDGEPR